MNRFDTLKQNIGGLVAPQFIVPEPIIGKEVVFVKNGISSGFSGWITYVSNNQIDIQWIFETGRPSTISYSVFQYNAWIRVRNDIKQI